MAFGKKKTVEITPPNLQTIKFKIVGNAPMVQNKFSSRTVELMAQSQAEGGGKGGKSKNRAAKDFELLSKEATHISEDGWEGIPCGTFRKALISACRLLGFPMTMAKLSIFVQSDGYERDQYQTTPLVRITKGKPKMSLAPVKNASGVADIRPRPMWQEGWEAIVTVQFDADQFSAESVSNLMARAGLQVGVGAGRPDSRDSAGCGWGTFVLAEQAELKARKKAA